MDTLYYSPGACSLIVHCLLEEMGSPFEARRVDLAAKEHHGEAYRRINPKGKVPALVTAEGTLTESMAIIEHICDRQVGGVFPRRGRSVGRPHVLVGRHAQRRGFLFHGDRALGPLARAECAP